MCACAPKDWSLSMSRRRFVLVALRHRSVGEQVVALYNFSVMVTVKSRKYVLWSFGEA